MRREFFTSYFSVSDRLLGTFILGDLFPKRKSYVFLESFE